MNAFAPVTAPVTVVDNGVGTLNFNEDGTVWGRLRSYGPTGGFAKFKGTWTAEGHVCAEAEDGRWVTLRVEKFAGAILRGHIVDEAKGDIAIVGYAPKGESTTTYGLSKEPTTSPSVVPFR
jgi:hypothetical protein